MHVESTSLLRRPASGLQDGKKDTSLFSLSGKRRFLVHNGLMIGSDCALASVFGVMLGYISGVKAGLGTAGVMSISLSSVSAFPVGLLMGTFLGAFCVRRNINAEDRQKQIRGLILSIFQMIALIGLSAGGAVLMMNGFESRVSVDASKVWMSGGICTAITSFIGASMVALGIFLEKTHVYSPANNLA